MTPEFWALFGIAVVVVWQSNAIIQSIHIAAVERRQDHRELLEEIESLVKDVGFLEMYVGAIDNKINPPDLSDYE